MGCASSSPLMKGGKIFVQTAKDSAHEIANKGDEVIHNVGESAKDGIETVKDKIGSVVESAEDSVHHAVNKISETFLSKKSEASDAVETLKTEVEEKADDFEEEMEKIHEGAKETGSKLHDTLESEMEKIGDEVHEMTDSVPASFSSAISGAKEEVKKIETETLNTMESMEDSTSAAVSAVADDLKENKDHMLNTLLGESEKLTAELAATKEMAFDKIDLVKETINENTFDKIDSAKQKFNNGLNEIDKTLKNALKLEDVDDRFDMIGNDIENGEHVKKVFKRLPTPIPSSSIEIIPKKEQATLWETAADAYLRKPKLKESITVEVSDSDLEAELGSPHCENEIDSELVHINRSLSQGNNETIMKKTTTEHSQSVI